MRISLILFVKYIVQNAEWVLDRDNGKHFMISAHQMVLATI